MQANTDVLVSFCINSKEGMDPLLELEDVLSTAIPEPRSLITYIHSIYQHFHDKAEKAKAEKDAQSAWSDSMVLYRDLKEWPSFICLNIGFFEIYYFT